MEPPVKTEETEELPPMNLSDQFNSVHDPERVEKNISFMSSDAQITTHFLMEQLSPL